MVSKQGTILAAIVLSVCAAMPVNADTYPATAVLADCDGARDSVYKTFRKGGGLGNRFDLYIRANNPGNNGRAGYVVNLFTGNLALLNDVVINLYSDYLEEAKTSTRVRFALSNGTIVDRLISEFTIKNVNGPNGFYECRYPAINLTGSTPYVRKIAVFVDKGPVSVDLGSLTVTAGNGDWRTVSIDPTSAGCSALPAPPK